MLKPAQRKMKIEKENFKQQTGRQRFDNIELLSEPKQTRRSILGNDFMTPNARRVLRDSLEIQCVSRHRAPGTGLL